MSNAKETCEDLRMALKKGWVLHGTKQPHSVLLPRQSVCLTGRPEGNLHAVYADRQAIMAPVIHAVLDGPGLASYTGDTRRLTLSIEETKFFSPGYVCVIPAKSFEDVNGEFISRQPVRVRFHLPVTPAVLTYLQRLNMITLTLTPKSQAA